MRSFKLCMITSVLLCMFVQFMALSHCQGHKKSLKKDTDLFVSFECEALECLPFLFSVPSWNDPAWTRGRSKSNCCLFVQCVVKQQVF